jgi:hypothetical protein
MLGKSICDATPRVKIKLAGANLSDFIHGLVSLHPS